ncbi:transglycosylase SLT domain-containing protein [Luteimonas sp. RD2P54]|uniref:Transglycosylase SLT domain-containing protein n=1 Tax=Luteimonas endophytica TaxID=3042023 RepID=A0ABT6J9E2_9GAMM|nr:transglycosylase SLT domain-containing protein [Luteimonas endophytica]MDH5823439.1 transglycosylase SLT domain-containing protein [Luteimonas endophytica]
MSPIRRFLRPLPLMAALAALVLAAPAQAQSRRERAAIEALDQRMEQAEARYREAMVRVRNNEPDAVAQGDAALEDMEDVMVECGGLRNCDPVRHMSVFKRLLKADADAAAAGVEEEEQIDPFDTDPDGMAGGIAADVPEAARAAALLSDGRRFVEMVQYNPAVQEAIRRWLTDMRHSLIVSHENYQYMRHLMWPHYQRSALPEALLFGIMAKESTGRVHSTSRAGAAGPMQFMYATGRRFGLGPDATGFDTRYDPYASAQASAAYLNERMAELNRSIELALAAYNGGEGRALRVFNASGGRSFWDESVYSQFPPETRDYVPMVIAAAWLFLHPKKYGLTFPKVDARPASLVLERPASIYELTICLGSSGSRYGYMRMLRNLNPRYQADDVIPAGTELNATARVAGLYDRWCTRGARAELARELVASDPGGAIVRSGPAEALPAVAAPAAAAVGEHRVARGESLGRIAERYGCSLRELAEANQLRAPRYPLRQGQRLRLQGCAR